MRLADAGYKAFISYSHASDAALAASLHSRLFGSRSLGIGFARCGCFWIKQAFPQIRPCGRRSSKPWATQSIFCCSHPRIGSFALGPARGPLVVTKSQPRQTCHLSHRWLDSLGRKDWRLQLGENECYPFDVEKRLSFGATLRRFQCRQSRQQIFQFRSGLSRCSAQRCGTIDGTAQRRPGWR